jgi:hypothetical protein
MLLTAMIQCKCPFEEHNAHLKKETQPQKSNERLAGSHQESLVSKM